MQAGYCPIGEAWWLAIFQAPPTSTTVSDMRKGFGTAGGSASTGKNVMNPALMISVSKLHGRLPALLQCADDTDGRIGQ